MDSKILRSDSVDAESILVILFNLIWMTNGMTVVTTGRMLRDSNRIITARGN